MTPLRRYLALMVLGLLLPLTLPPTRVLVTDIWRRDDVQARLDSLLMRGVDSTLAVMSYAKAARTEAMKLTVNGKPAGTGKVDTTDSFRMDHGCSMNADAVEAVLTSNNSPAAGKGVGDASVQFCDKEKIDNAYWLAMFGHESSYGTNPKWAGNKGDGNYTANTGNVICVSGWGGCYNGFADLDGDWVKGTELHFRLLRCYRDGGGSDCEGLWNNGQKHATIIDALNTWAPPSDGNNQNQDCVADPGSYPCAVQADVRSWRSAVKGDFVAVGSGGELTVMEPKPAQVLPEGKVVSEPLPMDGFGVYNQDTMQRTIRYSVESSPGLQSVTIKPGEDWSFNENWTADVGQLATEYGVLGAGVCDLAARYSNAAHKLGLGSVSFPDHQQAGVNLAIVPDEDNVMIWGTPGQRGGADLTIRNTTEKTVRMAGVFENGNFLVYGWFE